MKAVEVRNMGNGRIKDSIKKLVVLEDPSVLSVLCTVHTGGSYDFKGAGAVVCVKIDQ